MVDQSRDEADCRPHFAVSRLTVDGQVNLLDVAPFLELIQQNEYQQEADINRDGRVDLLDVNPFVDLLAPSSSNSSRECNPV